MEFKADLWAGKFGLAIASNTNSTSLGTCQVLSKLVLGYVEFCLHLLSCNPQIFFSNQVATV